MQEQETQELPVPVKVKAIVSLVGLPGTHTFRKDLCAVLNDLTDEYEFVYHSHMQDALMVMAGLYHGTIGEVVDRMLQEENLPAFHLYVERPQGTCLREIKREKHWKRGDYFKALPVFKDWAKFGEMCGQVLAINPEEELFGHLTILSLTKHYHAKVMADHESFLMSKINPDLSDGVQESNEENS